MTSKRPAPAVSNSKADLPLIAEVRELIVATRQAVATAVNASLTMLYWQIGTRIRRDILREKRAGYGDEILQTLSAKLSSEFGRGFSRRSLAAMVQFAGDVDAPPACRPGQLWPAGMRNGAVVY